MDRRKRILVSAGEKRTMDDLRATVAKLGLDLHVKMRLADVVDIAHSGLTREQYGYALRAHIDFVVSRDNRALFGVEFDGEQHEDPATRARDHLKDSVCSQLGFPLLRVGGEVPGQRLGNFSVIEWLIEIFLRGEAIDAFQSAGGAPGEYLDPVMSIEIVNGRMTMPLDPGATLRNRVLNLRQKGLLARPCPRHVAWHDGTHVHVATDVELMTGEFLYAHVRHRDFAFGHATPAELAEQLSLRYLILQVDAWLEGVVEPIPWNALVERYTAAGAPMLCDGSRRLVVDARADSLLNAFF